MAIMNVNLWKKAYMLEFLQDKEVKEVFTFSVPPESEDFDFPQRVSETKTFGGAVFDDYGNDTVKITLSGSTINEEKKYIYRGSKKPMYLTGEREIFYLQSIFQEWGQVKNLKDKCVYLYDLSKMNSMQIATGSASRNYWRVFIKDVRIKRDSSKPFTYKYTIEMQALASEKNRFDAKFSDYAELCEQLTDKINMIQEKIDKTELIVDAVDSALDNVHKVVKAFQNLKKPSVTKIAASVDSAFRIINVNTNNTCYNTTKVVLKNVQRIKGIANKDKNINTKEGTTFNGEKFVVTFNSNGGTSVPPQKVTFLNQVKKPDDPTKDKYAFTGWYTDAECTELYNFAAEVSSAMTLYAGWSQETATVGFNPLNGTATIFKDVKIGEKVEKPADPKRKNYVFIDWCTDQEATMPYDFDSAVTGDMTLYAGWIEGFSVDFNSNGGTNVESQLIYIGQKVVYPMTPEKENYQFAGWFTDEELENEYDFSREVNTSFTLYAKWVQYANKVIFNSNGGTEIPVQNIRIGQKATKPDDPTKDGNTFKFWCNDISATNEFNFNTAIMEETELYARWEHNVYAVDFNTNGGTAVASQNILHGNMAVAPTRPTKDDAVFDKWCKDEELTEEFDFATPITGPITLNAKWFGGE